MTNKMRPWIVTVTGPLHWTLRNSGRSVNELGHFIAGGFVPAQGRSAWIRAWKKFSLSYEHQTKSLVSVGLLHNRHLAGTASLCWGDLLSHPEINMQKLYQNNVALLYNVVVAPDVRGLGIGRSVLRDLLSTHSQLHPSCAVYANYDKSDKAARALYERFNIRPFAGSDSGS